MENYTLIVEKVCLYGNGNFRQLIDSLSLIHEFRSSKCQYILDQSLLHSEAFGFFLIMLPHATSEWSAKN